MSAVEVRGMGGIKRPQARHRWLNDKYVELQNIFETLPYNQIEEGEGDIGLVGVGMGYTYLKEAGAVISTSKYPILKLGTLPLPKEMVLKFLKGQKEILVFEEVEPVVENLIKQIALDAGVHDPRFWAAAVSTRATAN